MRARAQARRAQRKQPPEPVEPSEALRSNRRTLCRIGAGWVLVLCVDAILVRTHVLKHGYTGIGAAAGFVAGALSHAVGYGWWTERPHGVVRDGRRLVSARTLGEVRTVDLDALIRVRRYSAMGRGGTIDEYRIKDRHGIRLALTRSRDKTIDDAVRWGATRPTRTPKVPAVRVTRHARSALGLEPRSRVPQLVHLLWGMLLYLAVLFIPALISYVIANLLAGTSAWDAPPGS